MTSVYFISFALFLHRISRSENVKKVLPLLGLLLLGVVAAISQATNVALFLSLLVSFDMIAFTYGTKECFAMILIGLAFFVITLSNTTIAIASQAMCFGLLSEASFAKLNPQKSSSKKVEIYRDVVQIVIGLVIIVLFFIFSQKIAETMVVLLALIGYSVANLQIVGTSKKISSLLLKLEREYTKFGDGAIWLAIGTVLTMGFVGNLSYLLVIFTALFIGDAVATIMGINFKTFRLFYNKKKSALGMITYFLIVSLIGYFFVGKVILPIAFVGAIMESLPLAINDNFSVPLVLLILTRILAQ